MGGRSELQHLLSQPEIHYLGVAATFLVFIPPTRRPPTFDSGQTGHALKCRLLVFSTFPPRVLPLSSICVACMKTKNGEEGGKKLASLSYKHIDSHKCISIFNTHQSVSGAFLTVFEFLFFLKASQASSTFYRRRCLVETCLLKVCFLCLDFFFSFESQS